MMYIETIQDFDPAKIVLLDSVRKEFFEFAKQCEKNGFANLSESLSSKLSYQKLVKQHVIGRDEDRCPIYDGFELDLFGQLYYEYLKEKKRQEFIYGVRWWVTTLIAIAAIIISAVSIWLQYRAPNITDSQPGMTAIYSDKQDNTRDTIARVIINQNGG